MMRIRLINQEKGCRGVAGAALIGAVGAEKLKVAKKGTKYATTHTVYALHDGKNVEYIDRTLHPASRELKHLKTKGKQYLSFKVLKTDLSYNEARGLEHRLYLKHGGKKKLLNKIRPISKKKSKL